LCELAHISRGFADHLGMSKHAAVATGASSEHRPGLRLVDAAAPLRSAEQPQLPWTPAGDGRFELHESKLDVVLSPVPEGQHVRLLEVNGHFHILTGKVTDDRAMQVVAEDVVAGF
jgi:hypothetical protein